VGALPLGKVTAIPDSPPVASRSEVSLTYRTAGHADRDAILRVLETANFHHVPSPEMPELDVDRFFVAEHAGTIVGVAGYKVLGDGQGKTTLMAVDPAYRGRGAGRRLQELRMEAMHAAGCTTVTTNADLPATIAWYKRNFGYREIGTLAKLHEFGDPDIDHWTTLRADLDTWAATRLARQKEQQ
jgi:N-acetylglutamate synthase-like GNAT family acetyltransferase